MQIIIMLNFLMHAVFVFATDDCYNMTLLSLVFILTTAVLTALFIVDERLYSGEKTCLSCTSFHSDNFIRDFFAVIITEPRPDLLSTACMRTLQFAIN